MTHDIVPPRLNSKPYIHLPSQWKRCSHTCGYSPQCGFNWNKHLVVHLTIAPKQSCPPLLIWRVAAFSSTPSQHSGRARWHMAYTWSSKSLVWRTASKPPKHFLICKKSPFCVVETTTTMFGVLYCESFGGSTNNIAFYLISSSLEHWPSWVSKFSLRWSLVSSISTKSNWIYLLKKWNETKHKQIHSWQT